MVLLACSSCADSPWRAARCTARVLLSSTSEKKRKTCNRGYPMWQTMPGYVKSRCPAKSTRPAHAGVGRVTPGITKLCFWPGRRANRRRTLRLGARSRAVEEAREVIHRGGDAYRVDTGPAKRVPIIYHHNFTQTSPHRPVDNPEHAVEGLDYIDVFAEFTDVIGGVEIYPQGGKPAVDKG